MTSGKVFSGQGHHTLAEGQIRHIDPTTRQRVGGHTASSPENPPAWGGLVKARSAHAHGARKIQTNTCSKDFFAHSGGATK